MNTYTKSYLETALWSSTDENGHPLDDKFSLDDLDSTAIETAKKDVESFFEKAGSLLNDYAYETAMHDFWLTRNRHGAGFWDGDYGRRDGEKLTALSHSFGECHLYVGDDGKLYLGAG